MKIYTKTGDDGTTGLQGDKRVKKSDPRILAYGSVDEINSNLGVVLSNNIDADIREILNQIQNQLFVLGADLSNPVLNEKQNRISHEMIEYLEKKIDVFEMELDPIKNFILPGGNLVASLIHVTRSVTRNAEVFVCALNEREEINTECIKYLNRLSDFLFVIARVTNKRNGIKDTFWKP